MEDEPGPVAVGLGNAACQEPASEAVELPASGDVRHTNAAASALGMDQALLESVVGIQLGGDGGIHALAPIDEHSMEFSGLFRL